MLETALILEHENCFRCRDRKKKSCTESRKSLENVVEVMSSFFFFFFEMPLGPSWVSHSFWLNIWEWWRPLDKFHGFASPKVECRRSMGGQPICWAGTAAHRKRRMFVIERHDMWETKQKQAVVITCSDVLATSNQMEAGRWCLHQWCDLPC